MLFWALVLVMWGVSVVVVRWRWSGLRWKSFSILYFPRIYSQILHRWRSKGFVHLPASGPALVVSNHTCSADPTFLLSGSPRVLSFLVAREHFDIHPLTTRLLTYMRCVKVSRNGRDAMAVRHALRRLGEGQAVTIFPEGGLSGTVKKRLLPGKLGAAWLALVARVPVYPVFISGGPRTHKLVRSWLFPAPHPVHVVFGKPIDLSRFYDRPRTRRLLEEVTAHVMQEIAALDPKRRQR